MGSILDFIFGGELTHYGVGKLDGAPGRGSGRYPLGSGKNPNQHTAGSFLDRIKELENTKDLVYIHPGPGKDAGKEFKGEQAVAKIMLGPDATTTMLRVQKSIASNEERSIKVAAARALRDQGLSLNEIAKEMGYENDSSVRSLLNDNSEARMKAAETTALYLKDIVDEKGMIDVGKGVERDINNPVSREKFEQALYLLELQGYKVYGGGVKQATNPMQQTNLKVLCPPGTEHKDIYNLEIHSVKGYEDKILADNGNEIKENKLYPPSSISSDRVYVRTAEEGGADKDGVIELRRGVKDLDLGNNHYAQVRIMVDGTHYLKGMAVYADDKDLPPGVDVIFNSKHGADTPKLDHFKKVKPDPENPFGALLRREDGQTFYDDPNGNYILDGKKKSLNAVNKTRQEGDWDEWSDKLPSQFLAKQSLKLAKQQLGIAMQDKMDEYNEIISCTNPAVKKRLLQSFADDCDSSSVHLQAASLPRQKYKVILPLTTIKDDEVYAPGYQDGEKVALVRFPHEGTYQIPILTVNNKNKEGQIIFGKTPKDMVGLTKTTANILSGADFDGDTVMVIPASGKNKIISRAGEPAFKDLKNFETDIYGPSEIKKDSEGKEHYIRNGNEYKLMKNKQVEMGKISNLITDMTIRGATDEELIRATKHSMVVIDAEKHHLDYKQSEKDNRIPELKRKYQGYIREDGTEKGGASTLISRAKGEYDVLKRQGQAHINQEGKPWYDPSRPPGALIYKTMDDDKLRYVDKKTGKTKTRTQKSTQMAETDDAYTLSSGRPMENAYAEYANFMKNLANTARTEMVNTKSTPYSPSAKIVYRNEVDSLDSKLNLAILNKPRERQAQIIAGSKIKAWEKGMRDDGVPDKTIAKEKKKYSQIQLEKARELVGAKRTAIDITDKEWEAIQAGAISDNKLTQILNHCDIDKVKERAMPRPTKGISEAKQARIKRMKNNGYTLDEIAKAVGVSTSTVSKYL